MRAPHTVMTFCLLLTLQVLPAGGRRAETPIKIGLLIQDKNSVEALHGAELAILKANLKGGYTGINFKLVVKSMEGPWGTGSKQAVTLIFDDSVAAILGSHDGRNAHLVEQVTAKERVVFISSWSGDPTLSQAFVPWFFNCVYNDLQQSSALADEIYSKKRFEKVAVITDKSYDSGSILRNFLKIVKNECRPEPLQLSYDDGQDIVYIQERLEKSGADCIILFVQPPASVKITDRLRENHLNQQIYCSLYQLDVNKSALEKYENVMFASPCYLKGKEGTSFSGEYRQRYGYIPGAVAAYAYDGMNILIEAIRKAGTEREDLQAALKNIIYEGVTGVIQFDDMGNRKGIPELMEIKNGMPVPVNR